MSGPPPTPPTDSEALKAALAEPHLLDLSRTLPGRIVWQARCCLCTRWLTDREAASCTVHEDLARCGECAFAKVDALLDGSLDVARAIANGDSR